MRFSLVLFAFLSFLVLSVPLVSAVVPTFSVVITVTDENENPVPGAEVEVDGISKTTDTSGVATFMLEEGVYTINAEYLGKSSTQQMDVQGNTSVSISLDEEDQSIEFFTVVIVGISMFVIVIIGASLLRRKRK